ncbi:hypothetical protein L843_5531 [Mycobacterium intracellulare MIN_061107_1834]|nr:hypothetical protein L843_5531 [Mycobacterium intracellulare MIN_061107_1834]
MEMPKRERQMQQVGACGQRFVKDSVGTDAFDREPIVAQRWFHRF